ncbi:MAG: Ig domain-containing protein, partial [Acidobacteriota bacterium]
MSKATHLLLPVVLFLGTLSLTSCGGGGANGNQPAAPTITSVTVSCAPASLTTGQTSQCSAAVSGTGSYSTSVTWSVSPASAGAISSSGIFTSADAGTATITATSAEDSTKSGKTTITVTLAAPSNLVYPQTTIAASVGHAITPDTPTVTGVVTSYTVSPALPQGLHLNASTGSISGTPTAAAAQAAYTITAANTAGSTTATIQISVVLTAPSNLVYPQTTIAASVGHAITPDTPTVTGVVTSYTVSPALPQGL